MYSISFTGRARKQFLKLDASTRGRVHAAIARLGEWPVRGPDIKRLRGEFEGAYRLRVGEYRVIFVPDEERQQISIAAVGPRGQIYRG